MTARGTRWRRPAPICVALAAAAHATVLLVLAMPAQHTARGPAAAAGAVTARYVADTPPPASMAALESPAPDAPAPQAPALDVPATHGTAAVPATSADTGQDDMSPAPSFETDAAPVLEHPDAPLPAEGVRLRVFVQLGAGGVPKEVSVGAPPGETEPAPAFQKAAARALRQAQFSSPGSAPTYCFLVHFEPGTPQPQLAWLPGAARDAARCLSGRQPPPRELAPATAAP